MKQRMELLFDEHKIRDIAMEPTDIALALYLIKELDYEAVLYGGGKIGLAAVRYLRDTMKISPKYVIDIEPAKCSLDGIPVYNLEEALMLDDKVVCFVTTGSYYLEDERIEILNFLYKKKCLKIINIAQAISLALNVDFYSYFVQNRELFIEQSELFIDSLSQETYYEYIRAFLTGDYYCCAPLSLTFN